MMKIKRFVLYFYLMFISAVTLRVQYVVLGNFPKNDGGLFYAMGKDLLNNDYAIPLFTSYNQSNIPFAYPPLGIYLSTFISDVFSINLLNVFHWLPLIINLIAIPFIFLFSIKLFSNNAMALATTAIWSIAIPSYEWFLMGGGVTRSLAFTFSIISLYFLIRYIDDKRLVNVLVSSFFSGVTGLSHIEIFMVHLILLVFLFVFRKKGKFREHLNNFLIYSLIMISMLTPYCLIITRNHGLSPFISALTAGQFSLPYTFYRFLLFDFTQEYNLPVIAVLAIVGGFWQAINKKYMEIIWILAISLVGIRSVNRSALLPLSILASYGLFNVVVPIISNRRHFLFLNRGRPITNEERQQPKTLSQKSSLIIILGLLSYIFLFSFLHPFLNENGHIPTITQSDIDAFTWVKQNTPIESKFFLTPYEYGWQRDAVAEWFPAIAERKSILTVQGTEWLSNNSFSIAESHYNEVRKCFEFLGDCLESEVVKDLGTFNYVWISKYGCNNVKDCYQSVILTIDAKPEYKLVYENEKVAILKKE